MDLDLPPVSRPVVTGASGFVGSRLVARLGRAETLSLAHEDWRAALGARDLRGATVIHLAGRVHDPAGREPAFEADNVEKTRALAEAAAAAGAARFVFASTVKVFGEETGPLPFTEHHEPAPEDAYARSKWRSEQALRGIAGRTGLAAVVLRLPLVYGAGAAGNFRALVGLADTGWWLPFAAIANRRSLVHVDDLVEAIVLAAARPGSAGRTFVVAHPRPVSTPKLVESIRHALGRPRRLFAVPPALLEAGAAATGMGERMRRLTRSLEVDPGAIVRELGWAPRFDLDAGIEASLRGGPA